MLRSCALPSAADLVVAQCRRERARLTVEPRLLLTQPFELLAQHAHLVFAPLLDVRDLLLQLIEILLQRSQRRQHLALLCQRFFLLFPAPQPIGLGPLALTLHPHLFRLLRLSKLGFRERQLLQKSLGLGLGLSHLGGKRALSSFMASQDPLSASTSEAFAMRAEAWPRILPSANPAARPNNATTATITTSSTSSNMCIITHHPADERVPHL